MFFPSETWVFWKNVLCSQHDHEQVRAHASGREGVRCSVVGLALHRARHDDVGERLLVVSVSDTRTTLVNVVASSRMRL